MSYQQQPDPVGKISAGASGLVAAVITFFLFPLVFNNSVDWIRDYSEANYGFGGGFFAFIWGCVVAGFVFAGAYLGTYSAIWLARSKLGGW